MAAIDSDDPTPASDDRLVVIARAVRTVYGTDAPRVAEHQIAAAEGEARDTWIAIANHLRE